MQQQPSQTTTTRCQAPVNAPQFCVLYLKKGKERRTAWMTREHAHRALEIMRAKYGERNAIVYMD